MRWAGIVTVARARRYSSPLLFALLFERRLWSGHDARDVRILFLADREASRHALVALTLALVAAVELLLLLLLPRDLLLTLRELGSAVIHACSSLSRRRGVF
jgi:hypothetical protein